MHARQYLGRFLSALIPTAALVAATIGARAVVLDVAEETAVERVIGDAGPLDVLVNNAGVDDLALFTELTPAGRALLAEALLGDAFQPVAGPPARPGLMRRSRPPASLRQVPTEAGTAGAGGGWLAEIGVGLVHCTAEVASRLAPRPGVTPAVVGLHQALKARFDPEGRLNPGRSVLAAVGA